MIGISRKLLVMLLCLAIGLAAYTCCCTNSQAAGENFKAFVLSKISQNGTCSHCTGNKTHRPVKSSGSQTSCCMKNLPLLEEKMAFEGISPKELLLSLVSVAVSQAPDLNPVSFSLKSSLWPPGPMAVLAHSRFILRI